jgi:hypothetical protein
MIRIKNFQISGRMIATTIFFVLILALFSFATEADAACYQIPVCTETTNSVFIGWSTECMSGVLTSGYSSTGGYGYFCNTPTVTCVDGPLVCEPPPCQTLSGIESCSSVYGDPQMIGTVSFNYEYCPGPPATWSNYVNTGQNCYVPETEIPGCTNPAANNYNSSATVDNGSCTYCGNVSGTVSCATYAGSYGIPSSHTAGTANYTENTCNGNITYNGGCSPPPVYGCTDSTATNYNPSATNNDGSCTYSTTPVYGCDDPSATNFNSVATANDGSCIYPTCTGVSTPSASLCSGDSTGLSGDVPKQLVDNCTPTTKCEYTCNSGFVRSGSTCISSPSLNIDLDVKLIKRGNNVDIVTSIGAPAGVPLSCTLKGPGGVRLQTDPVSAGVGSYAISVSSGVTHNVTYIAGPLTSTSIYTLTCAAGGFIFPSVSDTVEVIPRQQEI